VIPNNRVQLAPCEVPHSWAMLHVAHGCTPAALYISAYIGISSIALEIYARKAENTDVEALVKQFAPTAASAKAYVYAQVDRYFHVSDWTRETLSSEQVGYAARDAPLTVTLYKLLLDGYEGTAA
jgi:hypothetical protein